MADNVDVAGDKRIIFMSLLAEASVDGVFYNRG